MNTTASQRSPAARLESKPLGHASIQDIQLELIRRRRFNAFNGQRVAQTLLQHRNLWEAAMMDRIAVSNPGYLPALGLVKLRDLLYNQWNVDTLYVLTPSEQHADQLAEILRASELGGMVDVHGDPEEVDTALGGAQPGQAVVSVWWD